jgi:hypothetical protein
VRNIWLGTVWHLKQLYIQISEGCSDRPQNFMLYFFTTRLLNSPSGADEYVFLMVNRDNSVAAGKQLSLDREQFRVCVVK